MMAIALTCTVGGCGESGIAEGVSKDPGNQPSPAMPGMDDMKAKLSKKK